MSDFHDATKATAKTIRLRGALIPGGIMEALHANDGQPVNIGGAWFTPTYAGAQGGNIFICLIPRDPPLTLGSEQIHNLREPQGGLDE